MRKDLKMGMMTGVAITMVATLIVSVTAPTPETRLIDESSMPSPQGEPAEVIQVVGPVDTAPPDEIAPPSITTESKEKKYSVGPKIHIVAMGETLSTIAQQYYGTTDAQQTIMDANAKFILDADALRIGTRLVIP